MFEVFFFGTSPMFEFEDDFMRNPYFLICTINVNVVAPNCVLAPCAISSTFLPHASDVQISTWLFPMFRNGSG
jgi:hypothetical protein